MQNFFVYDSQVQGENIYIEGTDVNHIVHVLRMKVGEEVSVHDDVNRKYLCRIEKLLEERVVLSIVEQQESDTELSCPIYLFQGLPKGDKMEWIIQKTVELGVYEVIPVAMKNCVVKLDDKKAKSKVTRWQAIAESAAKQSKRSLIPEVKMPMSYKEAVAYAKELDVKLVPYENEHGMAGTKAAMEQIKKGESIAVFIGPEGGFAPEEIALVQDEMQLISLGKRILRTETAGIAALAILGYQLESSDMIE